MLMGNCGCGCSTCQGGCSGGCGCKGVITDGVSIVGDGCAQTVLRGYRVELLDGNYVVTRPNGEMFIIKPGDGVRVVGGNLVIIHADGKTETIALHPAVSLTKNQDVAGALGVRATFEAVTQVLNIPPAIAGRLAGVGLAAVAGYLTPAMVTGMVGDYATAPGMIAAADRLMIPRTGRYNISGSWGTDTTGACTDFVLVAAVGINGLWAGRYSAPSNDGVADQVAFHLPGQLLQQGDAIILGAFTDCNDPEIRVTSAYLAVEYIEGT